MATRAKVNYGQLKMLNSVSLDFLEKPGCGLHPGFYFLNIYVGSWSISETQIEAVLMDLK